MINQISKTLNLKINSMYPSPDKFDDFHFKLHLNDIFDQIIDNNCWRFCFLKLFSLETMDTQSVVIFGWMKNKSN